MKPDRICVLQKNPSTLLVLPDENMPCTDVAVAILHTARCAIMLMRAARSGSRRDHSAPNISAQHLPIRIYYYAHTIAIVFVLSIIIIHLFSLVYRAHSRPAAAVLFHFLSTYSQMLFTFPPVSQMSKWTSRVPTETSTE